MLFNISFALAALIHIYFPIGAWLVTFLFGPTSPGDMTFRPRYLLYFFASYIFVAIVIYITLRLTKADRWLRTNTTINNLIGAGNLIIIVFHGLHIWASFIPGGSAGFMLTMSQRYFLFPAWFFIGIGLLYLSVQSIRPGSTPHPPARTLTQKQLCILVTIACLPFVIAWISLNWGADAPMQLDREARALFKKQCRSAGEDIRGTTGNVESLYFNSYTNENFLGVRGRKFAIRTSYNAASMLVVQGYLSFAEVRNAYRSAAAKKEEFDRYDFKDLTGPKISRIDEISSAFGLLQENLIDSQIESRLHVTGKRLTIKNLESGQIIATLTYFADSRNKTLCGQPPGTGSPARDFVVKILGLKKKYHQASTAGPN